MLTVTAAYDRGWDEGQGCVKSGSSPCPHQVRPVPPKENSLAHPKKAEIKVVSRENKEPTQSAFPEAQGQQH